MKTERSKAEAYVREALNLYIENQIPCPDGMVGCCVLHVKREPKPIQLQHWLRVLNEAPNPNQENIYQVTTSGELVRESRTYGHTDEVAFFNLLTGQPATGADYKAFNDIVGI